MTVRRTRRRTAAAVAATAALAATGLTATGATAAQATGGHGSPGRVSTGPSTRTAPYVLPAARGVSVRSLFTVGDGQARNGYRFVGIPDGIGTYRAKRNRVVYVNHELRGASVSVDDKGGQTESPAAGIVRAHGRRGAFVSRLVIDERTGRVKRGRDLIQGTRHYDYASGRYTMTGAVGPEGAAPGTHGEDFSRFCSGALTERGQLYDRRTGRGTKQRLYFANEESGDEGRAFAVDPGGLATQLPRLGLFSWENTLAAHNRGARTVVMGNEDGDEGQLRVYAGTKTRRGGAVQRAGLTNGVLKVLDLADESVGTDAQFRAKYGKGRAVRVTLGRGEVVDHRRNGVAQNAEALAKGLTLNRIEDGAFDPGNRHHYYFHTTEGGDTTASPTDPANASRDGGGLWRLAFRDVDRPELGGTLTLLLDGSEAPYLNKPDNMDIDGHGNLLIQEDPGTNDALARIVAYRIRDGRLGVVARFDPALFGVTNPAGKGGDERAVLTTNEESSGIVGLGRGRFLFDAQVHTAKGLPAGTGPGTVEELVERGQLLTMTVRDWRAVYGRR